MPFLGDAGLKYRVLSVSIPISMEVARLVQDNLEVHDLKFAKFWAQICSQFLLYSCRK